MAHRIASVRMTLSDPQGHSATACFFIVAQQLTSFKLAYCVARSLCDSGAPRYVIIENCVTTIA